MGAHSKTAREATAVATREPPQQESASSRRWFQITPAILHSIDSDGRLVEVNERWLAKFGYRREEALGRPLVDFLAPTSRERAVRETLPEFFRTGSVENFECQMVCKDGRVLDFLLSAVLDTEDLARGIRSLAVLTDVTALRNAERNLAESAALYRGLIESQTELVSLATPDGQLCFVNDAYARHYERRPHELIGANLLDFVPADHRGSVMEQLLEVCRSRVSVESENLVVMPNGQTRWMSWTNRAITDAEGRVTAIHSVGRDIQRLVVAEERLKASEARYRMLAENSSDMVMLVGRDGKRNYVSPACQKLLGWTPEEMMAMKTSASIHPDDLPRLQNTFADGQDARVTLVYRMRRKDGVYISVEAATQRVEIPGQTHQRLLVVRDIEPRVEAERRLKESETSYRLLADNSSDMVFQLDRDLVRRYVSPASREILGYEPSELIGAKSAQQSHPDDADQVVAAFRSLLAGDVEQRSLVNRRRHRDGRWIWIETRLKALKDAETGAPSGIVGVLRDISERKAIEDQLAEANRRLEILAAQDGLSGLANRRVFDEALKIEHRRACREKTTLALVMIDIDRFKAFNDCYGHPAGDDCLKSVAGAVAAAIRRSGDLAARYGGEEFVVLLPNTDERGAAEVAEVIRLAVRALALEHVAGVDRVVTISAGVAATLIDPDGEGPEQLLKNADRALYRAKESGRDHVVNASWLIATDPPAEPITDAEAS